MATPHRDPEASPPARNGPELGDQRLWRRAAGGPLPCQRPAFSLEHLENLPLGLAFLFFSLDLFLPSTSGCTPSRPLGPSPVHGAPCTFATICVGW